MDIIFQAGQIVSNYLAAWVTGKNKIIFFKLLSAVFNALAIMSVGRYAASIPVLFTIVRSIVCMNKEKFKSDVPIWLCVLGYIMIIAITFNSMESYLDLLPTITSMVASLVLWYGGAILIKSGLGVSDTIWMIYYFYVGLYFSALNILFQTIVAVISIIRIKLKDRSAKD